MEKIKLFVIDDDTSLIIDLKEYFKDSNEIEIILEAEDGSKGIELIDKKQEYFDMILLDLVMPYIDGIEVLKYLKENKIDKRIIVLTSYRSQEIIRRVSELGADYYILKPFQFKILEEKIKEVYTPKKLLRESISLYDNNLQVSITKILHELGVPSHIKGYQYIREGISMIYHNPNLLNEITKEIYPEIAKKYHSTTSRVERAIRHAIEISWSRANWDLMEEIFGYSIDVEASKPTNSEYLVTIADKIRLDYHKPINHED